MSAAGHYQLGVDLGTTWTAAAVARDGQVHMVGLGNRAAAIPSVVHQAHDGTTLTGDGDPLYRQQQRAGGTGRDKGRAVHQ